VPLDTDALRGIVAVCLYTYESMVHGFIVPGRDEFDAIAAREANFRALDLLSRTVGSRVALAS
jgi:hypothetical protein